jgi:PAS domain S-box-containing protein
MISPVRPRRTTFWRYSLFLELSALLLISAILFLAIWLAMGEMSRTYLAQRLADANKVELFIDNQLNEARQNLERFIELPESHRSPEVLRLLGAFSDIYRLDGEMRLARIYKATAGSRVFTGFSLSGGKLGGYLQTLDARKAFSEVMRGYEDDAPSVYLALRTAGDLYLGRLNLDYVQNLLSEFSRFAGTPLMLVTNNGFVMLSADANLNLPSIDLNRWSSTPSANRGLHAAGQDWIPLVAKRITLGARIVTLIPTQPLETQHGILLIASLGFLAGMTLLVYLKNRRLNRLILQPIADFAERMRDLEQGRPVVAESHGGQRFAELDSIHTRFRTMAEAIAQRERSLRESEEKFRLAFDNANTGMCLVDIQGRLLQANDKMTAIFGYPRQALEGMAVNDLAEPEDQNPGYVDHAAHGNGDTATFEKRYRHREGQIIYCQVASSLVRDALGQPRYFIAQVQDVSERRRYEKELQQARDAAELANRAKSTFLAHMSHEIRTPLNAIIGMTYLMGQRQLGEAQRRDLQMIDVAGRNLLALVNDILDVSKIEAGELELDRRPFALAEVLHDLRVICAATAVAKGLTFDVAELPDGLPTLLVGDSHRLRQILVNLLNNAIKFTPTGGVTLRIDATESPPTGQSARLRVRVTDTGIGMSPAVQAKLFHPFVQADSSTSREFGGTGLGLSIVKRLVELMGGSVGVVSRPGSGSTFWLDLPFEVAGPTPPTSPSANLTRTLHVLAVDGDRTDRQVLKGLCAAFGWNVEAVESGAAMGERLVLRLEQLPPIDFLVLDDCTPQRNVLSDLAELRQRIGATRMPAVIVVAAQDRTALQQATTDLGPHSLVTKPVSHSSLFNAANAAMVARGHDLSHVLGGTLVDPRHGRWLEGARALVVDDSAMNLEVVQRLLASEGAHATLFTRGDEALAALRNSPDGYDLVLMDLQMPGLDGCATTRLIREQLKLARLPIVALTAGATTTEQQRASAAGMDDFLSKPVDPSRLVRVLRRHIETFRGQPLLLGPTHPPPAIEPGDRDETWPAIAGVNTAEAAAYLAGDVALFIEILGTFVAENAGVIQEVRRLVKAGDRGTAARRVHKLRGQAANICAGRLRDAAGALEDALNGAITDLDTRLAAFDMACAQLLDAARVWLNDQP